MSDTPERDRLLARWQHTLLDAHISWCPTVMMLTSEEYCAVANRMLDAAEADRANTVPIPVRDLREIYKALKLLAQLGQSDTNEWLTMPLRERELRHQIFLLADFPAMFAGQRLPKAVRAAVAAELAAPPQRQGS